ncbi:hypothetical protein F511_18875 [Dorcoceras hygrometricum]|uniref:Uncharacterized protein n=1 Tax=Dorcoceras hygrometricum TaxID=472368 RepID=A0A2Z7CC90_9LAMI|nr:hypothetical protein F511_18875 [Dorcoceras hygrometricum]
MRQHPGLSYPQNKIAGSKQSISSPKSPKEVVVEASRQGELNATNLATIRVVYRRQSEEIDNEEQ